MKLHADDGERYEPMATEWNDSNETVDERASLPNRPRRKIEKGMMMMTAAAWWKHDPVMVKYHLMAKPLAIR